MIARFAMVRSLVSIAARRVPRASIRTAVLACAAASAVATAGASSGAETGGLRGGLVAPATFEDIYGPSGASFRAALGFRVSEGRNTTGPAQPSLGASVDDMVVQWREYKLVDDASDCATSGACATVEVDTSIYFEVNGNLGITVTDASPYGQGDPVNDCNQDGDFTDAGIDDADCNDNGASDVVVRATSFAEPSGEPVVLDRVGTSATYRGEIAISSFVNIPGVLFFYDGGPNNSEITIRYDDRWDGSASGIECRASSDPADWGIVSTTVDIPTSAGGIAVVKFRISDASGTGAPPLPAGQDGDGFPDTNETVDLFLTVRNQSSSTITNLVAQVSTNDPKIDCIFSSIAGVASVPPHVDVDLPVAMRFKVAATADRAGLVPPVSCASGACSNGAGSCTVANDCKKGTFDGYSASFTVVLASDQFDINSGPQSISIDLDLNSTTPVKTTSTLTEGFESGFGNMSSMSLDDSIQTNTLSNGRRCQYNDPDFVNSNSFGDTECYLGFTLGQDNVNDWHVHDTSDSDGGRAYLGIRSMHYGIHTGQPGQDTYGLSQLDAIRTKNAINLAARICLNDPATDKRACNSASDCVVVGGGPCVSASPELSFKHQISLVDSRSTGTPFSQTVDRGVVQAQINTPGAVWQKLTPYQNVYDKQGTDNFSNCLFDPIDDGNTEDSYFDPTDPDRRLGPSSTCFPEFVFDYLGDTDEPFGVNKIGNASDGPGLPGSMGIGTWVESKFDLSRFRGRPIRVRWLLTSIKVQDLATYQSLFQFNPNPADDGWYVDDVRVTQTLGTSVPTVTQDTASNAGLPGCGVACSSLSAVLTATPSSTPSPGVRIVLSTMGSSSDRCVNGILLSEYWIDGNANGALGDPEDVLVRPFAVDPLYEDAPTHTTQYAVRVQCSSAPGACTDTKFKLVTVNCPGTPGVYDSDAWWTQLRFTSKTTLEVPPAGQQIDGARGDLLTLRATGSFGAEICLADGSAGTSITDASVPSLDSGFYYLLRGADSACNENRSWRTFSPKENPTDPPRRDTQISTCSP